jgi:hypothetical protein
MVLFINVIIFTHLELWTNKKTTILIQLLPKKKGLLNISSPNQNQTKPNHFIFLNLDTYNFNLISSLFKVTRKRNLELVLNYASSFVVRTKLMPDVKNITPKIP